MGELLSFIIVNFNSGIFLEKCINSIYNKNFNFKFEVIIVDNASNDNSMSFKCPLCDKIFLKENIGFVKGNNLGVNNAKSKYLYFLNPDTVLLDQNIKGLIEFIESNDNVGIVSPKVLNSDGSLQLTCRKEPTLERLFLYTFGIAKVLRFRKFVDYKMEMENFDDILFPDWVSGCGFIISKELFIQAGKFDEDLFMYWEDVSICREIRKLGYSVVFNPLHCIIHHGGVSSSKTSFFSSFMDIKSRFIYFKKYYSKLYLTLVKLLTYTNLFFRGIWELLFFRKRNAIMYLNLFFKTIRL